VLGALAAATFVVVVGVAFRVARTDTLDAVNLVWNLVLAWVPLLLALAIYDGARRGAPRLVLLVLGVLWLLFLPNAPYIVTDAKWLWEWESAPLWYDAPLVGVAATIGLALGFLSLFLLQRVVARAGGEPAAWLFAATALALSAVGVSLGRFQRWNSWDLLHHPGPIARQLAVALTDPLDYPRVASITVAFALFLLVTYVALALGLRSRLERLVER
jgi:uncharacterized membrane protein